MANSVAIDDLDNAVGGYGAVVDLASQLGITVGGSVTCHGGVVGESGITAGAVALQLATVVAGVPTWQAAGTPVSVTAGGGATIPAPSAVAGAVLARVVVTTPIVGGKATAIITV
ncbi:MAG TPA: hypothetical protein VMU95_41335 [Trebonia sp.]|nr:hypothetical protein [Trebonia sp.]